TAIHAGGVLSPFNAWLIMRGLVTLPLRMQKHSANATEVARFLESHPRVTEVRYPGLESHPQHDVAARQMSEFSGMINFSIDAELMDNFKFLENLRIITHAVSLGHDQSLILYIPTMFFFDDMVQFDEPQKAKYSKIMGEGIFRFSVGIENADDLIRDLKQALERI
ncbi:MAG: PLP-dependent transferase, partial [Thermodesulfobacteriota bacterium]